MFNKTISTEPSGFSLFFVVCLVSCFLGFLVSWFLGVWFLGFWFLGFLVSNIRLCFHEIFVTCFSMYVQIGCSGMLGFHQALFMASL